MPFAAAKAVAATFCWNIRHVLTPIFGVDFLSIFIPPNDTRFGRMIISPDVVQEATETANYFRKLEMPQPIAGPQPTSPHTPECEQSQGYGDDDDDVDVDVDVDDDDENSESDNMRLECETEEELRALARHTNAAKVLLALHSQCPGRPGRPGRPDPIETDARKRRWASTQW
jgi:hypothetical protein